MTTIYVVTSGSYSDYGIEAMFSTKENADLYIGDRERDGWDGVNVEEYELDAGMDVVRRGIKDYTVDMNRAGEVIDEVRESWPSSEVVDVGYYRDEQWHWRPALIDTWKFVIRCESKEQAIKVANERRTRLLATEQWVPIKE